MAEHLTPFEALSAAVTRAGSQAELARICGVSATAVWKWVQSSKRVPAEYVLRAEAATGVSRHDLRPDIYPREQMTDHGTFARFLGIDQRQSVRRETGEKAHAADVGTRIGAVDFNRPVISKAASA